MDEENNSKIQNIFSEIYVISFQTLHLRAQQSRAKRPPPPSLKFIPSATAIAPAILCHKERKLSKQMEINLNGTDKNEVRVSSS